MHTAPPLQSASVQQTSTGRQAPEQSFFPGGQEQVPPWQDCPAAQSESRQQSLAGMQALLHGFFEAGQAQAPPEQTLPPEQSPQCKLFPHPS
jgi:hypothetical protein